MASLISTPQKLCPGEEVSFPSLEKAEFPAVFSTRKARVQDVNGMSTLINEFASTRIMLPRGPLYLYQNIQDYRVITVSVEGKEVVVACGGVHVLWEDLAEVRSVAVHPELQRKGLGRIMVNDLIADAHKLGVAHLFTFTLSPEFFSTFGFGTVERESLSPVVWAECSKCPKFYKCDEVGMMLDF